MKKYNKNILGMCAHTHICMDSACTCSDAPHARTERAWLGVKFCMSRAWLVHAANQTRDALSIRDCIYLADAGNQSYDVCVSRHVRVVCTQVLGFGWAGIFRRYLVEPAAMWWPSNLVQVSLFRYTTTPQPFLANMCVIRLF